MPTAKIMQRLKFFLKICKICHTYFYLIDLHESKKEEFNLGFFRNYFQYNWNSKQNHEQSYNMMK